MTSPIERAGAAMRPVFHVVAAGTQPATASAARIVRAAAERMLADVATAHEQGRSYPGRDMLAESGVLYEFTSDPIWNTVGVTASPPAGSPPEHRRRVVVSLSIPNRLIQDEAGRRDMQLIAAMTGLVLIDALDGLGGRQAPASPLDHINLLRWSLLAANDASDAAFSNSISLTGGTPFSEPSAHVTGPTLRTIGTCAECLGSVCSLASLVAVSIHDDPDGAIRIAMRPVQIDLPLSCADLDPLRAVALARMEPMSTDPVACFR